MQPSKPVESSRVSRQLSRTKRNSPLYRHCLEIINSKRFLSIATLKGMGIRIAPFCAIWVATNYVYVKALGIKDFPPTDVTALFSSAPAFVFILSRIILKERVTVLKVILTHVIIIINFFNRYAPLSWLLAE